MSDLPVLRERMGDWVNHGACRQAVADGVADPSWWFPGAEREMRTINLAKQICEGCVVKSDCLDWAVQHEQFGIWGGIGPRQREYVGTGRKTMCRVCERPFPASTSGRIYCSDECSRAHRLKRRRQSKLGVVGVEPYRRYEKVCPICSLVFMGRSKTSVYCTQNCKVAARRELRRARRDENSE